MSILNVYVTSENNSTELRLSKASTIDNLKVPCSPLTATSVVFPFHLYSFRLCVSVSSPNGRHCGVLSTVRCQFAKGDAEGQFFLKEPRGRDDSGVLGLPSNPSSFNMRADRAWQGEEEGEVNQLQTIAILSLALSFCFTPGFSLFPFLWLALSFAQIVLIRSGNKNPRSFLDQTRAHHRYQCWFPAVGTPPRWHVCLLARGPSSRDDARSISH